MPRILVLCIGLILLIGSIARGANLASSVTNYNAGNSLTSSGFQNSSAALGGLNPVPGPEFDNAALSPFNPPFHNTDIVIIGGGGSLTLQYAQPVAVTASGPQLGVFVNNGLIDDDYPHGQAGTPAGYFSDPPSAIVSVSSNGTNFFDLNGGAPITFDNPTNYWADLASDPSDGITPGTIPADISKPFTGSLSDFDGLDWTGIKSLLNGSAGGNWLDFRGTGLSNVDFIRFIVPVDVDPQHPTNRMVLDAVSSVPEPATAAFLAVVFASVLLRRK